MTTSGNFSTVTADYVGWNASTIFDLTIDHKGAYNIDFLTNGNPRMIIESGGNIGIGTTSPTELLDVAGNINIANTQFYSINGVRQLYTVGTTNLLVGNSGNTTLTGANNVAVGLEAGA